MWAAGVDRPVVVLADLPHRNQRLQVLVGLERVDVVQRAAVPRIPVRRREVDGYLQTRQPIRDQDSSVSFGQTTCLHRVSSRHLKP